MSDLQEQPAAELSTTIDTAPIPGASGAGTPSLSDGKEAADPPSLREDIEAAFKEEKDGKADDKAANAAKEDTPKKDEATTDKAAEAKPGEKAAEATEAPAKEGEQPEKPAETSEAREKGDGTTAHKEPPKNFLPDSREVWKNVPRVVRRDIESMTREHEAEITEYRTKTERYEPIKSFDDLARSNGIELKDSLKRVVDLENLIQANPLAALNRILREAGPLKADGQPFSLYEVADFIVKQGPQGYQQLVSHRQQEQQQGPREVDQLRDKVAAMEAEMKAAPIINAFAAKNDRYYELEGDIALFLQSGKVPASLGPEDRLAAAYDMAVRINPASNAQARPSAEGEDAERRAGEDFSGSKSIKSSPGAVTEEVDDQAKGDEPIRESIRKAARSLRAA